MATWNVQQLTGASQGQTGWPATGGMQAASDPTVVQYKNQMHVCYVGASDYYGKIWDVWYDGHNWNLQLLVGETTVVNNITYMPRVPNAPVAAVGGVCVAGYDNNNSPQMHVCYADAFLQKIWDVWYDGHNWNLQLLAGEAEVINGISYKPMAASAPSPVGAPVVVQFKQQMHVCYRSAVNDVGNGFGYSDVWYDGHHWQYQTIPSEMFDPLWLPLGASEPAVVIYDNNNFPQMHVSYRCGAGANRTSGGDFEKPGQICDTWYPGEALSASAGVFGTSPDDWIWSGQTLLNGTTVAPLATGTPVTVVYDNNNSPQMHVCYNAGEDTLRETPGLIWDVWYDGHKWNAQLLISGQPGSTTINGCTSKRSAPPIAGDPAVVQYKNQMHVCYTAAESRQLLDPGGLVWDVWYDSHNWQLQLLTGGPATYGSDVALTSGPPAAGNPVAVVYDNNNSPQMHVCYLDSDGNIQDCWYGP
jgi:hypothetical protein